MSKLKRPRWTDECQTRAWTMHRQGKTIREIAKIMGRSPTTISERLLGYRGGFRRVDIEPASRPIIPQKTLELREALYAAPYPPSLALMGDPQPGRRELIERYR